MAQLNYANIFLEDITDEIDLSVRAYNFCRGADLMSLDKIMAFYSEKGSFMGARNCGVKTNKELIAVCERYEAIIIADIEPKSEDKSEPFLNPIGLLTPLQRAIVDRHFEYLQARLGERSQNGLARLSELLNIEEIFQIIGPSHFNFEDIGNIGMKSVEKLEKFKLELIQFITIFRAIQEDQLSKEYVKSILKIRFHNLPENFEQQFENGLGQGQEIKIFTLLDFLINSEYLFNKNQQNVFRFAYYDNYLGGNTFRAVGKKLSLSGERVSKIKSQLENKFQSHFGFASNLIADGVIRYQVNQPDFCYLIDTALAKKINENENVHFNVPFYAAIFGILLRKTHFLLQNQEMADKELKTKKQKPHLNQYLISIRLFKRFDFSGFIEDICLQFEREIKETRLLHFQNYLYQFIKVDSEMVDEQVYAVCESIIFKEFGLTVNSDGYLTFEKNAYKPIHEYCFDILDAFSRPMTIHEIEIAFSEKYPLFNITHESIRSALVRNKKHFIHFGRESTYGLKKWESEKANLKGGTIRDLAEGYLLNQDAPKHISEIAEYVLLYRPKTNKKSVLSNLMSEQDARFITFEGGFIGCRNKIYQPENSVFKKTQTGFFTKKSLRKFNDWDYDLFINHYCQKNGYKPVQVESIILQRIKNGEIQLSKDNKLII